MKVETTHPHLGARPRCPKCGRDEGRTLRMNPMFLRCHTCFHEWSATEAERAAARWWEEGDALTKPRKPARRMAHERKAPRKGEPATPWNVLELPFDGEKGRRK